MSTKHIFDSPDGLVLKSLRGAVALNPSLRLHPASKSVYVASPRAQKVAVISGGGAGHEPAHASYTGHGMLTASISGDIFASPSANAILSTIKLGAFTSTSEGNPSMDVLVVINNYTGDRLNFGVAIEKARATFPDIKFESVVVADDVSLLRPASRASLVGPRGLGGNILVCKLLGAYAARGASLEEVKILGDAVVGNLASIGVGLEHCHVPGRRRDKDGGEDGAVLGPKECEIGLGLHNEPGVRRAELESAEVLIAEMLKMIITSRNLDEGDDTTGVSFVKPTRSGRVDDAILFVNNLGGMSQLEMGAVLDETLTQLEAMDIHPLRIYMSSFMTSLNAPGFSLSLLNVSSIERSYTRDAVDILQLLDEPTDAAAWLGVRSYWPPRRTDGSPSISSRAEAERDAEQLFKSLNLDGATEQASADEGDWWRTADVSPEVVRNSINTACDAVLRAEPDMTHFDTIVGDGDCGETFASGAKAIQAALNGGGLDIGKMRPSTLVRRIGEILETSMGGTIGALFALFFTAWSAALQSSSSSAAWPATLAAALSALSRHTPARPGDRTIIDALEPFCHTLNAGKTLQDAVIAAREGAESTKGMKARLGRAVYVGEDQGGVLPPDPGAWGIAVIVEGLYSGLLGQAGRV